MIELSPFVYKYQLYEGRLLPTEYTPQDELYSFILGSEQPEVHLLHEEDYVEVYQNMNLTGVYMIRPSAGFLQPDGMPDPRVITGSPLLQRGGLLFNGHPKLVAEAIDIYRIEDTGDNLKYKVDGGSTITVTFSPAESGLYTAPELVSLMNPKLTNATASAVGPEAQQQLQLEASSSGSTARLQVVGGTMCNTFQFPNGPLVREVTGNALDYMTKSTATVHLENGAFSSADVGKILQISHSLSNNNGRRFITGCFDVKNITVSPSPNNDEGPSNFMLAAASDGVYSPRVAYGADDLSGMKTSTDFFTVDDWGLPVLISGAMHEVNNGGNRIDSVQEVTGAPNVALLHNGVTGEGSGFTAKVLGARWKCHVTVDNTSYFSYIPVKGRTSMTNDIAVNVSKLSGTHRIGFKMELLRFEGS